jgi:predicted DNA-binding protein (MmcQ/YjbR family)
MTYDDFNVFCGALPAATYGVQWGGAHVWKVGGKIFAVGGWEDDQAGFAFKASATAYEILKDQPGLRPAPYLAARGIRWIQHYAEPGLQDGELKDYVRLSHQIVSQGLPARTRTELGLT